MPLDKVLENHYRMINNKVMPGKRSQRLRSIAANRQRVYEALKRRGMSKKRAARIANAGKTKLGRHLMAKKAARTRSRRGRG